MTTNLEGHPFVVRVTTSQELADAFKTIADGGRIELAPGAYGYVSLNDRKFDQGIKITSEMTDNEAVFTSQFAMRNVSGVTLESVDLQDVELAHANNSLKLAIYDSSDLVFRDMDITGYVPNEEEGAHPHAVGTNRHDPISGFGYGQGVMIRNSSDVSVANVEISDLFKSITLLDSQGVTISGAEIHSVREGINLYDSQNIQVSESHFHHFQSWGHSRYGDHADMIQFWANNRDNIGIDGLKIMNNVFYQPGPALVQTINGGNRSNDVEIKIENLLISDNLIVNSHTNSIRLGRVEGLEVEGNTLLPGAEAPRHIDMPAIILDGVTEAVVTGNTTVQRGYARPTNLTEAEAEVAGVEILDHLVLSRDGNSDDFWRPMREAFADRLPEEPDGGAAPMARVNGTLHTVLEESVTWEDYGQVHVQDDGNTISVWRNGWKAIEKDMLITSDTVLKFDFASRFEGEIHGIGFANGDDSAPESFFALDGSDTGFGMQDFNGLYMGEGEAQSYEIPVGEFLAGESFDRLVLVADDDGGSKGDSTFWNITLAQGEDVVPSPTLPSEPAPASVTGLLEAGTLVVDQPDADAWHSVSFEQAIPDARVVMGPLSYNGPDPSVVRVRNVTDTGFEVQIEEWLYLDGAHMAETVSWIAGSAGQHRLATGQSVAFGRIEAEDDTAETVALDGFDDTPAVFAQITSHNGGQTVTDRIDAVTQTGFSVRMREEEANDQAHFPETLDWMAIDYDTGGGFDARRAEAVDDRGAEVAFDAVADELVFIADMQTENGPDTAALRTTHRSADTARLIVEEEQSADEETWHTDEAVAYLALAEGSYDLFA